MPYQKANHDYYTFLAITLWYLNLAGSQKTPSEKAVLSAKPACKFELSSTESIKTGFTVRHKPATPTTARPSRNGLTMMFYISKSI